MLPWWYLQTLMIEHSIKQHNTKSTPTQNSELEKALKEMQFYIFKYREKPNTVKKKRLGGLLVQYHLG